ncbi:ATP-binding protein [Marinomonas mediterranea]|jgi:Signal transduction histidine kinase|uniref:histidine kinase n=1 Tax=Marinomonas mediterranea (strain ATCC 700492 / JCM 21426 / NBRC 103028 / MMB-1) TaxID=717774 RepID=F2K3C9_MARM1|nr:ATP-binding protein [Marinomonas mediterranea]ADZ91271.1 integral membrane sensor signal transduction histidine kinase [Marinomonas mediterranea MMB-1]WCN09243.1 two-component sensor histidine kinase [Marinomonas mediterranea]WCN13325.1 two-component sensor histidine kinase [Marinomonas mediterranea]WCN17393.1 two-component sensor histidine kinase [Marinomonas mediterranea MMB-1]
MLNNFYHERVAPHLPSSIKKRTVLFVMSIIGFTSLIVGVIGTYLSAHEVEELFDARLAQQARQLAQMTDVENFNGKTTVIYPAMVLEEDEDDEDESGLEYEGKLHYQLFVDDKLVVISGDTQLQPYEMDEYGFGKAEANDHHWYTFSLTIDKGGKKVSVVVGERSDIRGETISQIAAQAFFSSLVTFPILALLVWGAVRLGLDPLNLLVQRIKKLNPHKLEVIEMDDMQEELTPIQTALNTLLSEIDLVMEREKRWIADAAHELRTPLAVLKLHAQNASTAEDAGVRAEALAQLSHGVDRSSRIVEQLLASARVENQRVQSTVEDIDVLTVTRSVVAGLYPIAWERSVTLELIESLDVLSYPISQGHLEILLQNLVSNAIKFSYDNSTIEIGLEMIDTTHFQLSVIDEGVGVSSENRERLLERFFRSGEQAGAGLGLSIVKSIVDIYEAEIRIEDTTPHGLSVFILFKLD